MGGSSMLRMPNSAQTSAPRHGVTLNDGTRRSSTVQPRLEQPLKNPESIVARRPAGTLRYQWLLPRLRFTIGCGAASQFHHLTEEGAVTRPGSAARVLLTCGLLVGILVP